MSSTVDQSIEDGHFDDPPEDSNTTTQTRSGVRDNHNYIDESVLEWSDDASEDEGDEELLDEYDRVEDEDWEITERGNEP